MTSTTCDTSVLIPALASWHPAHAECRKVVMEDVTSLPAQVLVEAYSVLTRLPAPHRIAPAVAERAVTSLALPVVVLSGDQHRDLIASLARASVSGGAVYDGIVAATSREHDLHLLTRDRRARATYDALGVGYTLVR